ncbi:hypothetical protein [Pseudanabaena sp. 'Roaring Creek']|uniref:hypothetical protein n=1 Tax=Pseudanabaena sp. 'Roaring Creek' TaxID=1681830 RepID=UPI0006D7DE9F|nr:hypothetical protein [Pseudanabaena sp. 'Roaring Creek']
MSTVTVRETEYELVENEYASLNAILLFLILVDPKASERFAGMSATLEELQKEITDKYNELSESGKKSINEMSTRVMFALNADPTLFPNTINYRSKAYGYVKTLVPTAPILDENFAGTLLSEFLLVIAIPESLREQGKSKDVPSTPNPPKRKKRQSGFAAPNEESLEDKAARELTEKLQSISLENSGDTIPVDAIAAVDPEFVEIDNNHYASLLALQQKNTVTLLDKEAVAVPDGLEEEFD